MPNRHPAPDRLFHALGDPTRLAVIQALCREPASVSALAAPHAMALPSFLQHLRVLEECGWIRSTKTGRVRTCEVNPAALRRSTEWLAAQRSLWESRLDQLDAVLIRLKAQEKKS